MFQTFPDLCQPQKSQKYHMYHENLEIHVYTVPSVVWYLIYQDNNNSKHSAAAKLFPFKVKI